MGQFVHSKQKSKNRTVLSTHIIIEQRRMATIARGI